MSGTPVRNGSSLPPQLGRLPADLGISAEPAAEARAARGRAGTAAGADAARDERSRTDACDEIPLGDQLIHRGDDRVARHAKPRSELAGGQQAASLRQARRCESPAAAAAAAAARAAPAKRDAGNGDLALRARGASMAGSNLYQMHRGREVQNRGSAENHCVPSVARGATKSKGRRLRRQRSSEVAAPA